MADPSFFLQGATRMDNHVQPFKQRTDNCRYAHGASAYQRSRGLVRGELPMCPFTLIFVVLLAALGLGGNTDGGILQTILDMFAQQ